VRLPYVISQNGGICRRFKFPITWHECNCISIQHMQCRPRVCSRARVISDVSKSKFTNFLSNVRGAVVDNAIFHLLTLIRSWDICDQSLKLSKKHKFWTFLPSEIFRGWPQKLYPVPTLSPPTWWHITWQSFVRLFHLALMLFWLIRQILSQFLTPLCIKLLGDPVRNRCASKPALTLMFTAATALA